MSDSPLQLRELLRRLVESEIRFVVVGGLAVNAWGYLRGTLDIDIVPDPDPTNLGQLTELLVELGGKVEVGGRMLSAESISDFLRAGDKALIDTPLGQVDVLQGLPTVPSYADLEASAVQVDMDEFSVRVCSLDHLLAMKQATDCALDAADVEALMTAHPGGDLRPQPR